MEMFKLNRGYEELVKRLNIERVDYMKYLPCAITVDYFDDNTVENKHLPVGRIGYS